IPSSGQIIPTCFETAGETQKLYLFRSGRCWWYSQISYNLPCPGKACERGFYIYPEDTTCDRKDKSVIFQCLLKEDKNTRNRAEPRLTNKSIRKGSLLNDSHCSSHFYSAVTSDLIKSYSPKTSRLHYHVGDVPFDDVMLRVKIDHGQWPALCGNTA
ncbi:hypothetical protein AMECASPLE_010873, partial [Ameca splendens]